MPGSPRSNDFYVSQNDAAYTPELGKSSPTALPAEMCGPLALCCRILLGNRTTRTRLLGINPSTQQDHTEEGAAAVGSDKRRAATCTSNLGRWVLKPST